MYMQIGSGLKAHCQDGKTKHLEQHKTRKIIDATDI